MAVCRLLLAGLMGQCCFARWRLLSVVCRLSSSVTLWMVGGRHCTAGQYGYVPLGRHLVVWQRHNGDVRTARRFMKNRKEVSIFQPTNCPVVNGLTAQMYEPPPGQLLGIDVAAVIIWRIKIHIYWNIIWRTEWVLIMGFYNLYSF